MATNKPVLREIEEFMSDYTPVYRPIYPLFLEKSQSYSQQVGKLEFRRVNTVGDIRGKHITPKDTEMRQVAVTEQKKAFKKYFLANQYQISQLQDQQGTEEVVARVLDEHQKQADELFLFGEGTSNSNMINNGLYHSNDANYQLNASAEVALNDRLYDLHNKVMSAATDADYVAGRKIILFYGSGIIPVYKSLYETAVKPFKMALQEVLGADYSLAEMPGDVTPSGQNGFLIANVDQIKTHYTALPSLESQGSNDEKKYNWFNFVLGSMMVEVLAEGAVIRQPLTLEA